MSLKTGFAQIFSCCPKNLSCLKFGGAAAFLAPRPIWTMATRTASPTPRVLILGTHSFILRLLKFIENLLGISIYPCKKKKKKRRRGYKLAWCWRAYGSSKTTISVDLQASRTIHLPRSGAHGLLPRYIVIVIIIILQLGICSIFVPSLQVGSDIHELTFVCFMILRG